MTSFLLERRLVVLLSAMDGKKGNATEAPAVVMNCLRENFIKYYVIM
jgi:hypothetical protein